ncbi:MAG: poly-gamma-glutamate biosynthesis protein PgsC/CapC, partial [Ilumatobacter sp.]
MHDYLLSSEWVRFAFVLGVAVSMVMYEKRHLTTGSIVVPGYIAVFLIHPLVIVATFLNAFATYLLVNRLLRRYFLLYGRTKFTLLAIISTSIQTLMLRLTPSGSWLWEADIPLFIGVGYVVPALIAHDMARQGVAKTTKSVLMSGVIVAIPIGIALVLDLPGVNDLAPVSGFGRLALPVSWLPLAVILSILASWAVAHNYDLRSGGFVGAAFVGMFMADPWQLVIAVVIALATFVIVAKFLMKHMILFGRRKFSSMLLVSASISWSGLWIGDRFLGATWR